MVQIRAEHPEDIPAIARITRSAFDQTQGEEVQMIEDIRASVDFLPELSLVAGQDGALVGHQLISRARLLDEHGEPAGAPVLLLGPISVLPQVQRRGIGGALIRHGLDLCRARPEPMIVLVGHPEDYPRFGFRPAREFGLHPDWDAAMISPFRAT